MEWEEELVLRNRTLHFDKDIICKYMVEIVRNIQKYSKKYKANMDIFCVPGDFIHINGKNDVKIQFIIGSNILTIKSNISNGMFINVYLKEYYYLIEYKNASHLKCNELIENKKIYFLDKENISKFIKDILVFNNIF